MDMKELMKLQMMNGIMQQGMTGKVAAGGITNMVWQMLMWLVMSISDDLVRAFPVFMTNVKNYVAVYVLGRVQKSVDQSKILKTTLADTSISLNTRHFVNSLEMTRIFQTEGGGSSSGSSSSSSSSANCNESNAMVDAVLAQISKLHNVPSFTLIKGGQVMISYKDKPVQLTKDIFFKIVNVSASVNTGDVAAIKISLQSNTLSASEITDYVRTLYTNWLQEIKNSLGNNIYFFDQKSKDSGPPPMPPIGGASNAKDVATNHKRMMISTAPKELSFTMSPFYSNKNFANIYGDEIRTIEQRVKFFVENKDWYDRKGIPYQLGLLLSGIPGAGKTSVIRAMANMTRRHIVNVNFANITTATQLKNLFYSDRIQVYTDQSMSSQQMYYIPVEQRIYVLEEIDAIGDIVKQRTVEELDGSAPTKTTVNDELTLMEILTVLDGTMEIPGRMVIMTTNHPEVLDEALIRPGRIDVQVSFSYASGNLIAEMFDGYMDKTFPRDRIKDLPDKMLSPAEVGQVMFKHFNNTKEASALVNELIDDLNAAAVKAARKRATTDKHAHEFLCKNTSSDCKVTDVDVNVDDADLSKVGNENVSCNVNVELDKADSRCDNTTVAVVAPVKPPSNETNSPYNFITLEDVYDAEAEYKRSVDELNLKLISKDISAVEFYKQIASLERKQSQTLSSKIDAEFEKQKASVISNIANQSVPLESFASMHDELEQLVNEDKDKVCTSRFGFHPMARQLTNEKSVFVVRFMEHVRDMVQDRDFLTEDQQMNVLDDLWNNCAQTLRYLGCSEKQFEEQNALLKAAHTEAKYVIKTQEQDKSVIVTYFDANEAFCTDVVKRPRIFGNPPQKKTVIPDIVVDKPSAFLQEGIDSVGGIMAFNMHGGVELNDMKGFSVFGGNTMSSRLWESVC